MSDAKPVIDVSYCHPCRCRRRFWNGLCSSCGHPQKASYEPVRRESAGMICPACHSSRKTETEPGRYRCLECSSVYERPDTGYVDDRPEQNAIKNEAHRRNR